MISSSTALLFDGGDGSLGAIELVVVLLVLAVFTGFCVACSLDCKVCISCLASVSCSCVEYESPEETAVTKSIIVTNIFIHSVVCWHSVIVRSVILAARYKQRNVNPHARFSAVVPLYA